MKKFLSLAFIACAVSASAQIQNTGFENWTTDTVSFGFAPVVPIDTFAVPTPENWTTSNVITGNQYIGGKLLATQSSDAQSGTSALSLKTDSIAITGFGKLIVPGFAVNGNFPISLSDLITTNSSLSPSLIPGAGAPETNRKQKLRAYIKYAPIPNDSLLIWAVLKKNNVVIAEAKLNYKAAAATYTLVEKEFTYFSCEMPDTAVILIASSTPDFATALGGQTGIEAGSVLLVDSVSLLDYPQGAAFKPIANPDKTYTTQNTPKDLDLLANDNDCDGGTVTLQSVGTAKHGTVVIKNGGVVTYTPANNYIGADTFAYVMSDGTSTASSFASMAVYTSTGIEDAGEASFAVYPNPASNIVRINCTEAITRLDIVDMQGRVVISSVNAENTIEVSELAKGLYIAEATTAKGNTIKRRFIKE